MLGLPGSVLAIVTSAVIHSGKQNTSFDAVEANNTLHLAYAAFCNESALAAWDCQWCQGPGAYTEPMQLQTYLKDAKAGTQGYIALDRARKRVVVGYRGSKDAANYIEDADAILSKLPFGPASTRVHNGFLAAYKTLRAATTVGVAAALHLCGDDCSVLFTGHSLGAAMATIAATEHANSTHPVRLYTFGSPRVGNPAYAAFATAVLASHSAEASVRVRRQKDMVPAIPPRSVGYLHMPTEVYDKHLSDDGSHQVSDNFVVCDGTGEDEACGDAEEHPPFPLYLLHMNASEHVRYLGFTGGNCLCGAENCK